MDRIFMHCSIKVKKKTGILFSINFIFTGMPEGTLLMSRLPTPILFSLSFYI